MFETVNSAEIAIPADLALDEVRVWSYVQTRLHVYWFHVVYKLINHTGDEQCNIVFFSHSEQLIQLQQQADVELIEVNLVTPGYFNNSGSWKMEGLKEIWTGIESDVSLSHEVLIYILTNDKHYIDSNLNSPKSKVIQKELIFSKK